MKRKLAAILHADVAGYSRLMGQDEVGTHARLKAHRRVMDDLIARHHGRIAGTAGDAVLGDFPSVVEALSAAVDIQEALGQRNADLGSEQRLEFRIGVNLGDVIVDGEDIFGDGVNVAARVEALADPGGIAVSGAVYDQVRNKLDLAFRDRGAHQMKNIAEPVRVYAVGTVGGSIGRRPRRLPHMILLAGLAAIVLTGAAVTWVWLPVDQTPAPESEVVAPASEGDPSIAPLAPGKPTVAVLPFEDRGGFPEQAYFTDGITEDVIIDLGRFSNLLVLSWNAVAPYRGESVALEQLGRDLKVRYVVGGTVRRTDGRLRIAVQLTDAERGVLLWSERYDESLDDVFAVQDRITQEVVAALAVRVTRLERERVFEKPTESLDAYEHVLRGRDLLRRIERNANLQARAMFERALEIDPRYADANVGLGLTELHDFMYGWTEWPDRAIERARELAEAAIGIDDRNAVAHAVLARALTFERAWDRAEWSVDRAIELNPNNAMSHAIRGGSMLWSGRPRDAAASLELALRLDPYPVVWWPIHLAQAYYQMERYEDAVRLLDRFETQFEENPAGHVVLSAAHAQLGQDEEAARAVANLRRLAPFFDSRVFASHYAKPEHRDLLLEGLRKAGLE